MWMATTKQNQQEQKQHITHHYIINNKSKISTLIILSTSQNVPAIKNITQKILLWLLVAILLMGRFLVICVST